MRLRVEFYTVCLVGLRHEVFVVVFILIFRPPLSVFAIDKAHIDLHVVLRIDYDGVGEFEIPMAQVTTFDFEGVIRFPKHVLTHVDDVVGGEIRLVLVVLLHHLKELLSDKVDMPIPVDVQLFLGGVVLLDKADDRVNV